MSPSLNQWRALRGGLAIALAVGGFFLFITQTTFDRSPLSRVVISRTAIPGLHGVAKLAQVVDPSKSTFGPTKQAARRDPGRTGLYAREWYVSTSGPPEAGIVLQVLPDLSTARAVGGAVRDQLSTKPVLNGYDVTSVETFSVRGVPGASGTAFAVAPTGSSGSATGYAFKAEFTLGRSVFSELAVTAEPSPSLAPITADVQASARLLEHVALPSSFAHGRVPTTASIVYGVVALVVVIAAALAPEWVVRRLARRREHRRQRAEAQARSQYLARGRRTVRGRGAPPWAQPRKR